MLKVGLTGSIAVGKSFVCEVFRGLGCFVLDADRTAREVVRPGTPGLEKIIAAFGRGILDETGDINRAKLGAIVFADEEKRLLLNSIVHPLVLESQDRWMSARESEAPESTAIVDAALMIESGGYTRFDKLIVAWCEPAIQLQRFMLRDNLDQPDAVNRIAAQMTQDEKKRYADYLIDTSNGFEDTCRQTISVFEQFSLTALPCT